jgi:hypothetical protein
MLESDQRCIPMLAPPPGHLTLQLIHSISPISTYILLNHHKDMNPSPSPPPPQSSLATEAAGTVQEHQHPTEDDLLAIGRQRLQPSSSPKPLPETSSSQDISPHTQLPTSLAQPPAQDASVRIHDHLSTNDLLEPPTKSSPPSPDELIYTMPQYQPVSAGSAASPRTLSQVSPGFIFVNFLSLSVCCFFPTPSLAPSIDHWYFLNHVSYFLSPMS